MPSDDFIKEAAKAGDITYLTIYDGQLCQKRANPAPGFAEYTTQHSKKSLGKVVYIKKVDALNGYLIDIKKEQRETLDKTSKYNVLIFTFQSPTSGRQAKLEVGIKSNFVAALAKRIEVIDLFKPFEFGAFFSTRDGKEINWFKQDGVKVFAQFTKENPRDLPQWKKDETTGDSSNTEYWTYLIQLLRRIASEEKLNEVKEMLAASQADFEADSNDVEAEDFSGDTTGSSDGAPF